MRNPVFDLFPHPPYDRRPCPAPVLIQDMKALETHLTSALHQQQLEAAIAEGAATFTPKAKFIYGNACPADAECVVSHAIGVCTAPGLVTRVIAYVTLHELRGKTAVKIVAITTPLMPGAFEARLKGLIDTFVASQAMMNATVPGLLLAALEARAARGGGAA